MKWIELNRKNAEARLLDFYSEDCQPQEALSKVDSQKNEYVMLRNTLVDAYDAALVESKNNRDYSLDMAFGLKIYKIFTEGYYKMKLSEAANNDIWRYICIEVIPEKIMDRWKGNNNKLPVDHYYAKGNRIYLKSLWWYIHLSLQEDLEETRQILIGNSTDTILNLVERAGKNGYQPDLYRKIMWKFANPDAGQKAHDGDLFRKVMKLHTTRYANLEPSLVEGGTSGYVKALYDYFK